MTDKAFFLSRLGRDEEAIDVYDDLLASFADPDWLETAIARARAFLGKHQCLIRLGELELAAGEAGKAIDSLQDDLRPEIQEILKQLQSDFEDTARS